jgi:hypothetical protein
MRVLLFRAAGIARENDDEDENDDYLGRIYIAIHDLSLGSPTHATATTNIVAKLV